LDDSPASHVPHDREIRTVILLSLTASLNPTLVTATTVMLLLPNPKQLMLGYLLGAYFASITLGLIIVFALPNSSATNTTRHTLSPAVDIALGVIALVAAFVLFTGRHERVVARRQARKEARGGEPPRWQRELAKGSPRTTFVVGMLLTLPGASYLAGLTAIHKLDASTVATILLVVGFNVVMLWLIELPLACFAVAPEWTKAAIDRATAWVRRHAFRVAVWGLTVIGALLVVKGIVGLLA
jgi:asparagine N-glycosylation enzyme membrane subunit Stt3